MLGLSTKENQDLLLKLVQQTHIIAQQNKQLTLQLLRKVETNKYEKLDKSDPELIEFFTYPLQKEVQGKPWKVEDIHPE